MQTITVLQGERLYPRLTKLPLPQFERCFRWLSGFSQNNPEVSIPDWTCGFPVRITIAPGLVTVEHKYDPGSLPWSTRASLIITAALDKFPSEVEMLLALELLSYREKEERKQQKKHSRWTRLLIDEGPKVHPETEPLTPP